MNVVIRFFHYLKLAHGQGIIFTKGGNLNIEGSTDPDLAESIKNKRSISRYFTFVGVNLVTWLSKQPRVVARSSAKAEYRGMAKGV